VTTARQEAQWVLRAQCADRDALEPLLRSVQPSLRGYVARLVGAQDADDVVQEVFVTICRKLAWLQDPALFRPWMYRIATRTAFRYLKKARRYVEEPLDAIVDSMAAHEDQPSDEDLRRLLGSDTLSLGSRAVLVLHFQEELTLVEIAAVLEIPLGTVKSRLAFGLATLRKEITSRRV
jgi:RNA polymerase sigma-70 factor (ECF subfamily)